MMPALVPDRRTSMYHSQMAMGAAMADTDGWQLPSHYGDPEQELQWLRQSVGVSDVSSIGKVRVIGEGSAHAVGGLVPGAAEQGIGSVVEGDSPLDRGGKLLSVRLAQDEFLVLAPAGVAPSAVESLSATGDGCAHAIDVTSGLCGMALVGPATQGLMGRITEVDTAPRALPDLACVQSPFADVQGTLLRRGVNGIAMYQLYAGREFGEYLWEVLVEVAREVGGGPVGTQALLGL